jgi:hypothetical protein
MVFSREVDVDTHPVVVLNQLKSLFIEIPEQQTTVVKVVKNAEFHVEISVMSFDKVSSLRSAGFRHSVVSHSTDGCLEGRFLTLRASWRWLTYTST